MNLRVVLSHTGCRALAVVAIAALAFDVTAASAQVVRRADFHPIDDAGFAIVEQFYDYDTSAALAARVVESFTSDGVRVEKIVYTTYGGERVPGYLSLPEAKRDRYPCVLLLHGLNDSKRWWWEDERAKVLPERLLAAGIATFAIDLRLHGERAAANDYQAPMYLTFENTLFVRNRDMLIRSAIDARRALDYLATRGDIDTSRIAVAGYSMGGMMALVLSVLEPWLAAAVGCSVPSHLQLVPAEHYNFAARSNVPTLLLAGTKDWHTSAEDARALLALLRSPDKDLVLYDSGHRLPPEYAEQASKWLIARLTR